jgi:3-keto-5-aminohexanoate cleavage enzyme
MIIQFSTGGRSGARRMWGRMLPRKPDMASYSVGSNNFPTHVCEIPPALVDCMASEMLADRLEREIATFYFSHIPKAKETADNGQIVGTPIYNL